MSRGENSTVMIVAGEASGDMHGARLVQAMNRRNPDLLWYGIGGQRLRTAGVRVVVDASTLSVVGITEVISRLPQITRGLSAAREMLRVLRPDLLVLIDFPDFNLRIARTAKRLGIRVLYYISPQIWAWRSERVKTIKRLVDHMAVILPFEADFYRKHHVPVTFVGHPLLDKAQPVFRTPTEYREGGRLTVGFLPGSRESEISRHLPILMESAVQLNTQKAGVRFLVSLAPGIRREFLENITGSFTERVDFEIRSGEAPEIFPLCDLVVAASGTVTLQAAIHGVPMIIIYRVSPISYLLGRALIRVPHIGLINLVAGESIVPELIQHDATPDHITRCVQKHLAHPELLLEMQEKLIRAAKILGGPGASERVAEIAFTLLEDNS